MHKKSFYLIPGVVGTFATSFVGSQSVFANLEAIVKSYDFNKPDIQDELVKNCEENMEKYWDLRFATFWESKVQEYKELGKEEEIGKLLNVLCDPKNSLNYLNELVKDKKYKLSDINNFFSSRFEESLKDPKINADCRAMSCYVLDFLRKKNVKSYLMVHNGSDGGNRDVVIYAVKEKDEENWYVCDMEAYSCENLISRIYGDFSSKRFGNNGPLKCPLVDYVKNVAENNVTCRVYVDEMLQGQIVGKDGYTDEYWLLGKFIKEKCEKKFQDKCLIKSLTKEEEDSIQQFLKIYGRILGYVRDMRPLVKSTPFRIFERQEGPLLDNNLLDPKNFLYYSLVDEVNNKVYEDAFAMEKMALD